MTGGISTRLYQYADQEGASLRLDTGRYSNLSRYGFAKHTSSLTLIAPQAPQVCLYPEPNYQGMPTCIQSNIGKLENSQADRNSLIGANSANLNNRIASIRIPDGLSIEVYDEENYAADLGQRATLQGNVPNLFGYRLHQRISSIRVYPQGSRPQQAPQARARSAKTKTTQLANAQSSKADSGDEDGDGGSDAGTNTALSWLIPSAHAEEDAPNTVHYEDQQYYYHTDHLNGTRYLTDKNGDVVESNLTFPGGETWVNQTIKRSADDYKTPYTFTGKEQDASGLYYYGARYYDPRAQVWTSVDPILGDYLSGKRNGGVYRSSNLSLYAYTANNPVNFNDPTGLSKKGAATKIVDKFMDAYEAAKDAVPVRNKKLAGKTHKSGVPFDKNGYPDFSNWLYKGKGKSDVIIELTGSRRKDIAAALKKAKLKKTPKGYTWHHHQDKGRMQLVESKIHNKTGHTGGFAIHKKAVALMGAVSSSVAEASIEDWAEFGASMLSPPVFDAISAQSEDDGTGAMCCGPGAVYQSPDHLPRSEFEPLSNNLGE